MSTPDLRRSTPEALAWQAEQDGLAVSALSSLPSYAAFTELLVGVTERSRVFAPVRRLDRWFGLVDLTPEAEQPALVVGPEPGVVEQVLVDPEALGAAAGGPVALTAWSASPSGRYVAYSLAVGGDERSVLHVLDVATGQELPEDLPFLGAGTPRWLADESGFWIASREIDEQAFTISPRLHLVGGPAAAAEPVTAFNPQPVPSPDGRWVVAVCGNTSLRAEHVRHPDGQWRPFLADVPGGSVGAVCGDAWLAVLDGEHPHGRLVRIPFATADDRATWQEILPPSSDVLRQVAVVGDLIVVGYLRDAACGVRILRQDGSLVEELALPGAGTVTSIPFAGSTQLVPMVEADPRGFSFLFTSFTQSPTAYRWEPDTGLRIVTPPDQVADGLRVELVTATSADGTRVPAHVLRRADLADGPVPTLVYGYGGFNVGLLPGYRPDALAWVQAGGAYVVAHLRGGSEFGRIWWESGRMGQKQNVFDDLYAVADELVRARVASTLAVTGQSNGGLLTGVAITQRPELWQAVVSEVPVLDLLDVDGEPLSAAVLASEYGSPADPEQRAWLEAYSPMHNIRPDVAYPPLLVVSGENDPRCPPWHGRLFTQRLRDVGADVLLRVPSGQGHGTARRSALTAQRAEALAFCAHHCGLVPDTQTG